MSAELNELAERCEALSGPDREVDCLIYEADELRKSGIRLNLTPEMRGVYYGEPTGRYFDISGPEPVELPYKAPHYTASIDAAMTLVPDGWNWGVWRRHDWAKQNAQVWHPQQESWTKHGDAATPALAIVAAALRARSQAASQ